FFFFSSRRRHTRSYGDWSSDVCSSDLVGLKLPGGRGNAWRASCRCAQRACRMQRRGARLDFFAHGEKFLSGARVKGKRQRRFSRSEERRVGKEWRIRWLTGHLMERQGV